MAHIMHSCTEYAGDRLDIDIEAMVDKILSHFSIVFKTHRRIENNVYICGRRLLSCTETHTNNMAMYMDCCQKAT